MKLLPTDNINVIRQSIYESLGISHYPASTRSRKLRKVWSFACGLDLRRPGHCVILAQHLGVMARPSLPEVDVPSYEELFSEAVAKDDDRAQLERSLRKSSRIGELVARLAEKKAEVKASEAQFDALVRAALGE